MNSKRYTTVIILGEKIRHLHDDCYAFPLQNGYICASVTVIYMKLSENAHHVMTLHHTRFHINTPFQSGNTHI